jgi:hypothetical protein
MELPRVLRRMAASLVEAIPEESSGSSEQAAS